MKFKVIIFPLLCLIVASCNYNQPSSGPEMCFEVVKFRNDKYREYILAEEYPDVNHARMRGAQPAPEELIMGTMPYSVKLSNEYWVIDWRWRTEWIYPPLNVLLTHKWDELTHWGDVFEVPEERLAFREYIADYGFVKWRAIDEQLGLNAEEREKWRDSKLYMGVAGDYVFRYTSVNDIPAEEIDSFYELVHWGDSVQTLYIQRLTELVAKGKFNKVFQRQ